MTINKRRSFIVGLKSTKLSIKESKFLKKYKPWGVILFSRNIKNIKQTKKLTQNIKKIFKDKNYPILIDQEGGRINRFNEIIDLSKFTSEYFGTMYKKKINNFYRYYSLFINQISYLMIEMGININTVPVLDVRRKNLTILLEIDHSVQMQKLLIK
jgi:Beta-glucosidase-related glycosidases